MTDWAMIHGDSVDVLYDFPEAFADALVCDPPAGRKFMGLDWDSDRGGREFWVFALGVVFAYAYRCLKPGAHGLVWALPVTSHWTGCALENAGFEIRDRVTHIFGQGFTMKSRDLGRDGIRGWGTALKPAVEDWWLVQKPLEEKSYAAQMAATGTGGINLGACRVGNELRVNKPAGNDGSGTSYQMSVEGMPDNAEAKQCRGRAPSHLIIDDYIANLIDGQAPRGTTPSIFFYVPKPTTAEKEAGCAELEAITRHRVNRGGLQSDPRWAPVSRRNSHPTVKAIKLMRYLCRLITPPGGLIIDPFAGSGSTGAAAMREGFRFLGVERERRHYEEACARLEWWSHHDERDYVTSTQELEAGQMRLFGPIL